MARIDQTKAVAAKADEERIEVSAMETERDLHAELLERAGDELAAVHGSGSGHGWLLIPSRNAVAD